jgi:hypothetical protein
MGVTRILGLGFLVGTWMVLLSVPPTRAETWVEYKTNRNFRFFVDRDSVKKQGQIVWLWAYAILDTPVGNGPVKLESVKYYLSLDCRARAARVRQIVAYDTHKNYLGDRDPGDQGPMFRAAKDDIVDRQLFSNLCRR